MQCNASEEMKERKNILFFLAIAERNPLHFNTIGAAYRI
jgi:hypothetical protein